MSILLRSIVWKSTNCQNVLLPICTLSTTSLKSGSKFVKNKGKQDPGYISYVDNSPYGIYSLEDGLIREKAIEEGRLAITRTTRQKTDVWHLKADSPYTKKPIGTRMGKGKGKVDMWVARVSPGQVLFEYDSLNYRTALLAFERICEVMPVSCKFRRRPTEPRKVLSASGLTRMDKKQRPHADYLLEKYTYVVEDNEDTQTT